MNPAEYTKNKIVRNALSFDKILLYDENIIYKLIWATNQWRSGNSTSITKALNWARPDTNNKIILRIPKIFRKCILIKIHSKKFG